MKSLKKIKWLLGAVLLGIILFAFAPKVFSFAKEIDFSKPARMASQEEIGRTAMAAGSLSWRYGQVEERLGRLIRDAGPGASLNQSRLGKLIAEAAHFNWDQRAVQHSLGALIAKDAVMASNDGSIGRGNPEVG